MNNSRAAIVAVLLAIALTAIFVPTVVMKQPGAGAPDLDWLVGCWESDEGARECWTEGPDGYLGSAIADGEVLETLAVERGADGAWAYVARPRDQLTARFAIASISPGKAAFENPDHDFPTRIAYERDGDTLRAFVSGPTPEGEQEFVLVMRRVTE